VKPGPLFSYFDDDVQRFVVVQKCNEAAPTPWRYRPEKTHHCMQSQGGVTDDETWVRRPAPASPRSAGNRSRDERRPPNSKGRQTSKRIRGLTLAVHWHYAAGQLVVENAFRFTGTQRQNVKLVIVSAKRLTLVSSNSIDSIKST
jgi:hypothetical protein